MSPRTAQLGVVRLSRVLVSTCVPVAVFAAAIAAGGCDSLPWSDDEQPSGESTNAITACGGPSDDVPDDLACTGLYSDFANKVIAPTARHYTPGATLWSDGHQKDRYIQLPPGSKINTKEFDDWKFPVGTKTWKEFRDGDRKIETRFFWKVKEDKWVQASYVWSADGKTAVRGEGKNLTIKGKPYHVPKLTECNECHRGREDKVLGFEAVLLSLPTAEGFTLDDLVKEKRLTNTPSQTSTKLPDPAYGVLHANCGVCCHNGNSGAKAYSTELRFRLIFDQVAHDAPESWDVYKTAVGVGPKGTGWEKPVRVAPGEPDSSIVIEAMRNQGDGQMPPLGRTVIDEQGIAAIEAWIKSLPAK